MIGFEASHTKLELGLERIIVWLIFTFYHALQQIRCSVWRKLKNFFETPLSQSVYLEKHLFSFRFMYASFVLCHLPDL